MNTQPPDDREVLTSIYSRLRSQLCRSRQVGYEDVLQQELYFEILTEIGLPPTARVLDVGCGHGDLYAHLLARGYQGSYVGLDLVPHFIPEAKQRFPQACFAIGDILSAELEPCDYALAAGPFDLQTPNSQVRWQQAVRRMFELARCGIAWNGMNIVPDQRPGIWAQPLPKVLDLCANLSPYYSLRCDYDPPHYTAYVYKRAHFVSDELNTLIGHLYLYPEYAAQIRADPLGCAAHFGVSLQQLNIIAPLWMEVVR